MKSPTVKIALVVTLTAVMAALVMLHVRGVNGPWYWNWNWRRLAGWPLYASMLAAAAPFAAAQYVYLTRGRARLAVALLAVAMLALQLAAIAHQPPTGGRRLPAIVRNAVNTSYYTAATIVDEQSERGITVREWLLQYHDIVPLLIVHAKYKPPGLVLYHLAFIKLLGRGDASATAAGLGIALLAALAAPATYGLIRFFGRDRDAAFAGASSVALSPSLVLFLPQFDQAYAAIACAILILWGRASRDGRVRAAVLCGALLALGTFCSYIFLVLGCFIVVYWLLLLADRGADAFWRAAMNGLLALVTAAALYGALWAATGFDPVATFESISLEQARDLIPLVRPFPEHIAWDLFDFGMGAGGWIVYLIAIFYLVRTRGRIFGRSPEHRLVLVALIQVGTVAFAALLPGEVARLWMLLIPLMMAPVGFELARWPAKARIGVYACQWVMLVVIAQNMTFLYMGPELDGPRQTDENIAPARPAAVSPAETTAPASSSSSLPSRSPR